MQRNRTAMFTITNGVLRVLGKIKYVYLTELNQTLTAVCIMVLRLDGNSEIVTHVWTELGILICLDRQN